MSYPQTLILRDVEARWPKLAGEVAPTNNFGTQAWELQIATTDIEKAAEMRAANLKVKEKEEDGKTVFTANLSRKGTTSKGPNSPVKVVDASLQPVDPSKIGNGSKVNVNLWQYEYSYAGRSGIGTSLTGVQVVELVEYNGAGSVDFDAI